MEHGVLDLIEAKYQVRPIKVTSIGNEKMRSDFYAQHPGREEADRERGRISINYSLEIENAFVEGGFIKAANRIANFIRQF